MALGDIGVEDLFQLGTDYEPQAVEQSDEVVNAVGRDEYGTISIEVGAKVKLKSYQQVYRCRSDVTPTLAVSLGSVIGSVMVTGLEININAGDVPEIMIKGITVPGITLSVPAHTFDISADLTPLLVETAITDPASGLVAISQSGSYTISYALGLNEFGIPTIAYTSNPILRFTESGGGTLPTDTLPSLGIDLMSCVSVSNNLSNVEMATYSAVFSGPFVNPF